MTNSLKQAMEPWAKRKEELDYDDMKGIAQPGELWIANVDRNTLQQAVLGRDAEIARLCVIRDLAQHVWDTIPAEYEGPGAEAHARALNTLGAALNREVDHE
jgi:hypothetical protein